MTPGLVLINKRLIVFLVGLPLLLCLLAAWQVGRFPALDPNLAWPISDNLLLPVSRAAGILGLLGLTTGLAVFGLGLFSLLNIRSLGRQALESRSELLNGFQSGLKSLPWLTGSLGLLLALALSSVLMFELLVQGAGRLDINDRLSFTLVFLIIAFCLTSVYCSLKLIWYTFHKARPLFEPDPGYILGHTVRENEAPDLWRLVRSVAERIGTEPPDHLATGLGGGFFVTQESVRFSDNQEEIVEGRTLHLPLSALAFMQRDEAEAVIGHELAHFAGEDTQYSLHFAPIYAKAVNSLEALNQAAEETARAGMTSVTEKPVRLLVEYFLASFHLAVNHWSRERESAADRLGAQGVGSQAQARAMLKLVLLEPLVERAAAESWAAGGDSAETFLERLRRLVREEGIGDPTAHLDDVQSHPTDSHPPLRQRLADLVVPVNEELLAEIRRTAPTSLLSDLGLEEKGRSRGDDLKTSLENQFAQAAQENAETELEILRSIASESEGPESREFYESVTSSVIYGSVGIVVFLLAAVAALDKSIIWLALSAPLLALGLAFFVWSQLRRPKAPFLILGADGFRVAGADSPIPWTSIVNYELAMISRGTIIIRFYLSEKIPPPVIAKNCQTQYIKDNEYKEGHLIDCNIMGLRRPVKVKDLAEDI